MPDKAKAPKAKAGGIMDKIQGGKKYGAGPIQLTVPEWAGVGLAAWFIYRHFITPATTAENAGTEADYTDDPSLNDYAGSGGAPYGGGGGGSNDGGGPGPGPQPGPKPGPLVKPCGKGEHRNVNGRCVPIGRQCPQGMHMIDGRCQHTVKTGHHPPGPKPCGPKSHRVNGKCVPIKLPQGSFGPHGGGRPPVRKGTPHSTRRMLTTPGAPVGASGGGGMFVGP